MKVVRKLELNPLRRLIWVGFKLCVTPSKPLQMLKQPVRGELKLYIIFDNLR